MLTIISRTKAALAGAVKGWSMGNRFITSRRDRGASSVWLSGYDIDYSEIGGPIWTNSTVAALLGWEGRNIVQAPPIVETLEADGEWAPVQDHPLVLLFENPNQEYERTVLENCIDLALNAYGNAYILQVFDRTRRPRELHFIPNRCLFPVEDSTGRVDYFRYTPYRGAQQQIKPEELLHIRLGMNPFRPYEGMSPLQIAGMDDVATDTDAVAYSKWALRNKGLVGALATPTDAGRQAGFVFDPEDFVKKWKAKVTGKKINEVLAYDVPIDLQFPDVKPDNMAIPMLRDYPQAGIAALIGIPGQVVGLKFAEGSKTFANAREAREAAWEEKLIPIDNLVAGQAGGKLLPLLSTSTAKDAPKERMAYDYSRIRPLQPDLDKKHDRVRKDWMANLIDRATALKALGLKPQPGDKGVFYVDTRPAPAPIDGSGGATRSDKPEKPGKKALEGDVTAWAERVLGEIGALEGAGA